MSWLESIKNYQNIMGILYVQGNEILRNNQEACCFPSIRATEGDDKAEDNPRWL